MKPLKLELQAFGPYVSKQTVDFEKLSQKGIFLIKGDTGSGKTTIFDAMTFALYGGSSGDDAKSKVGRNDLEEWRCTQADDNTETYVSYTFSVRGRKYYFTRRLVPKRVNLSAQYEAGEIDEYGNLIPFFENPKKDDLNKKAEELIGLNKEQFRQVVLLPQGQFERFLTASSAEKQDILQKIFGSEQWSNYAEQFYKAAFERKKTLDDEKDDIEKSLKEDEFESITELNEKVEALKRARDMLTEAHRLFDAEAKQKALDNDRALAEKFKPLHENEKKYKELIEEKNEFEKKRQKYEAAEKAEKLRGTLDEYEAADEELRKREEKRNKLYVSLPQKEKALSTAKAEKEAHEKASPVESLTITIGQYEAKRAVYANLKNLSAEFSKADSEFLKAKREAAFAEDSFNKAVQTAADKKRDYDFADEEARNYRDRYYSGIYGEIAAELKENAKCPVCGSISHPEPAEKQPDSVSKADVEKKEKTSDAKKTAWNLAEEARVKAESALNEKRKAFDGAKQKKETAEANLKAAKQNLIENIADEAALTKAVGDMRTAIDSYNQKAEALQKKLTEAQNALLGQQTEIKTAKGEYTEAENVFDGKKSKLDAALAANGYQNIQMVKDSLADGETRNRLLKEITEYNTECSKTKENLEKAKEKLAGQTEPDSSKFDERQREISDESKNYNTGITGFNTEIDRLSKKGERLSKKQTHFESLIKQAESEFAFAKKLRGDSGIGLQRYVLAIMFNRVISEANRMLEKVHSGRYYLFRSDDKGAGNKRGLELKVHDSRSPDKDGRSVSLLSGGEKFLVSLALSIGMSAVAQKSGVQIEALFIDEGFGTLDDKSIHDAMDVLDCVRKGSGMIGIISHVQLLEANIPTHLEVIKSENGSSISLS